MKKILFVGETWVKNITHIKGYDTFVTCHYEDCSGFLRDAMVQAGYEVEHIAAHDVGCKFPKSLEDLKQYSAIVLSDIGSNTFCLTNQVFLEGKPESNSLENIRLFVEQGGGFLMVGGYMSFTGIEARARYKETPINDVIPAELCHSDDRVECADGVYPTIIDAIHPILQGIESDWKSFLGYNRLKEKAGTDVIMKIGNDVLLASCCYGKGRSVCFASDCAPHWGTVEFVNWISYKSFWGNIIHWLVKKI